MMQMFHERVYKSSQNDKTCEGEKDLDANPVGFYKVASLFAILLLGATLSQFVLIQECCKKFWTSRKGNQTDRLQEDQEEANWQSKM